MFHRSPNFTAAIALAAIICSARICKGQANHSATVFAAEDPVGTPYVGTSNPAGGSGINLAGGSPGYLNGINGVLLASGFTANTTVGELSVSSSQSSPMELFAVAIATVDAAGSSPHSLSSLNDPALADIVNDLNQGGGGYDVIETYAFGAAPSQFSAAEAALSAGEAANGGRPFDLLLAGTPIFPTLGNPPWWHLDLSNEVGNLDGITSLSVTDAGAIAAPEPGTLLVCRVAFGVMMLARRQTRFMSVGGLNA